MTNLIARFRWTAVVVVAASLSVVAVSMWALGYDPVMAAGAAWRSAFGSEFAVFSGTLKRATPLLTLGVAVALAFRAGVLNIGADGQFLAGAMAAAATGIGMGGGMPAPLLLAMELLSGIGAGAAWAGVAAYLKHRHAVNEVVSTLLLNFVAINIVGFLVRGPLQEPARAYPQTAQLPEAGRLPAIVSGQQLHFGTLIAVCVAASAWWYFGHTPAGFRARTVGVSASVARSAGLVGVSGVQARSLILSGAVAGLAGFCEVAGTTYAVYEGLSPGFGYTAIAVALLGNLSPFGMLASATMFGALAAGADGMQRDAGVPPEFATVAAAMIILGTLVAATMQRRRFMPGAGRSD